MECSQISCQATTPIVALRRITTTIANPLANDHQRAIIPTFSALELIEWQFGTNEMQTDVSGFAYWLTLKARRRKCEQEFCFAQIIV